MDGSYILYLMTSSDLDAVAVIVSLWFGQDLKSSSECHWNVHLDTKKTTKMCQNSRNIKK